MRHRINKLSFWGLLIGCFAVSLNAYGADETAPKHKKNNANTAQHSPPSPKVASKDKNKKSTSKDEDEMIKMPEVLVVAPRVITATRTETPLREIASSVTVISRGDLARKQNVLLSEVLRDVAGLDVVNSGGRGKATSVFMRGANSGHTLVLIDGVEMNDPISGNRAFNFGNLTTDNVERIEVLRGPQSTLYGSDAIGGVINIITRKGKGKPSFSVSSEYGARNTFIERASGRGGNDQVNFSFGLSQTNTDGISSAAKADGNDEGDGSRNTTFSGRLGLTPLKNKKLTFDFTLRYTDAKTAFDDRAGPGGDDPNRSLKTKQWFTRGQTTLSLLDDRWVQTLGFSYTENGRRDSDAPSAGSAGYIRSTFDGRFTKLDWQNTFKLHKTNKLIFGLETEEDKGHSTDNRFANLSWQYARTNSFYVQDQISLANRFFAAIGVRRDDHSQFGSKWTWRVAPTYIFALTKTKLKASYGTGFKAPTIFQLYAAGFGNSSLQPEKSQGWDFGFEQPLFDTHVTFGVTYYKNIFESLIGFSGGKYNTVVGANTSGIESFIDWKPTTNIGFRVNYTYLDTKSESTGLALTRRARHKASLDAYWRFLEKGMLSAGVIYTGRRQDQDFSSWPAKRVTLKDYTVVNLRASYKFTKNVELFGRVENVFDRRYQEVVGYGVPGATGYIGVKFRF